MPLPQPLTRSLRAVTLRVRLQRALDAGTTLALAGLGAAALVLGLLKAGVLPEAEAVLWLYAAAALPALGAFIGTVRPVSPLLAAQLLDRSHDLRDRIASAVAFSAKPEASLTPFESAAIDDAAAHASSLRASRAMPLRTPRDLVACVGLAVGVAVLTTLEVPSRAEIAVEPHLTPLVLHSDDI